jgi:serine/threonine protein kinase
MSPEQALGTEVDARSDLFSLGIVFWELLTGKRLFKAENELSTLRLVTACQVPPPSRVGGPPGADALVMKALAKDPADRYPDGAAFRLAIEDFILEHRLQASVAHLAAFMHELYKDRIAHLSDPTALDQLSGPLDQEPGSASASFRTGEYLDRLKEPSQPSLSRSKDSQPRTAPMRAPSSPAVPVVREVTQAVSATAVASDPSSSHKRWILGGAAVALAVLLGIMVGVATLGNAPVARAGAPEVAADQPVHDPVPPSSAPLSLTPPSPTPSADPGAPPTEPTGHDEKPAEAVVLRLTSEPQGASVRIGDRELGSTPVEYEITPDAPVVAVFSMPGFETRQALVSAKDGPVYTVQLTRKHKPKATSRPLGIKTGR